MGTSRLIQEPKAKLINWKESQTEYYSGSTVEHEIRADKRKDIDETSILNVRRKRNLLKLMFNHSLEESNIDPYRPEMVLRSQNKVKLKSNFTRITKIQPSPFHRGVHLWNALPKDIRGEKISKRFKSIINAYKF